VTRALHALYVKELRQLAPATALVLLVMTSSWVYLVTDAPDTLSWSHTLSEVGPGEGGGRAILLAVLALIVAFSLYPREFDDRTADFLHALPASRGMIFAAKHAAGATVLASGVLADHGVSLALHTMNPQSFTGEQFRFADAARLAFVFWAYATIVLSHGLALSLLRRFGIVIAVIAYTAIHALRQVAPELAVADVALLVVPEYRGAHVLVPWRALALHAAAAAVSVAVAAWAWTRAEDLVGELTRALAMTHVRVTFGALVLAGLVFASWALVTWHADVTDDAAVPFVESPVRFVDTARYRFSYREALGERALHLVAHADAVHDAVAATLGVGGGAPIVVDLCDESAVHAGLAAWKKIRMDITRGEPAYLLHVLRHETTHVLAARVSDRRLDDHARSAQFFSEGHADYVAERLAPDAKRLAGTRRLAATAWERLRINFDDLSSSEVFGRVHDERLNYALGESWVHALVTSCGEAAPGAVLRALARDGAPRDLVGAALWRDTLQAAGCDLERVNATWERQLAEVLAQEPAGAAAIPRLTGGVTGVDDTRIVVAIRTEPPPREDAGSWYEVRVRGGPEVPEEEVSSHVAFPRRADDGDAVVAEADIPRAFLTGRRFDFQLCVIFQRDVYSFCTDWQSADVPDAP
jgi:hypothetical protein